MDRGGDGSREAGLKLRKAALGGATAPRDGTVLEG